MKKMLIGLIASAFVLAAFGTVSSASEDLVGQKVFVKNNLIFHGSPPKVSADDIVFIEKQTDCSAVIWDFVIGRGAEVEIVKSTDQGQFVRLTIAAKEGELRDVLLAKSQKGDIEKSFDNAFSFEDVGPPPEDCEQQTEAGLIECLGYPIYKCRQNGFMIYYYNERFVGGLIMNYHDIWFKIEAGKVIDSWGLI